MHATYRTGGANDEGQKTRWNPSGLATNCGFCAVSYAFEKQTGTLRTADQLYLDTLKHLDIEVKDPNKDPLPRLLVFPEPELHKRRPSVEYSEIQGAHSLAEYTITAVARRAGLELASGSKDMVNALMAFSGQVHGRWTLDDFIRARTQRPGLSVRPSFAAMKVEVEKALQGNSIIGSKDGKHFMNMSFDQRLEWKLFDPQNDRHYDGMRAKAVLGTIDLFERISTPK